MLSGDDGIRTRMDNIRQLGKLVCLPISSHLQKYNNIYVIDSQEERRKMYKLKEGKKIKRGVIHSERKNK